MEVSRNPKPTLPWVSARIMRLLSTSLVSPVAVLVHFATTKMVYALREFEIREARFPVFCTKPLLIGAALVEAHAAVAVLHVGERLRSIR